MKQQLIQLLLITTMISSLLADEEDPFLWLEEVDGERALEWVEKTNENSVAEITAHPDFQSLNDRCLAVYDSDEKIAYVSFKGDFVYNFWKDAEHVRGLVRRTSLESYLSGDPIWEDFLDVDVLAEAEGENWVYKGSVWLESDYSKCVIRLSRGGGDAVVNREYDPIMKEFVTDGFNLPEAKGYISWIDKDTVFARTDFGEGSLTESGYPRIVKRWKRGTPLSGAELVLEGQKSDVSVGGYVVFTENRNYEILYRAASFYTRDYYFNYQGNLEKIDIPEDAELSGILKNQMIVELKSDWEVGNQQFKQGSYISIDVDAFMEGSRDFFTLSVPADRASISGLSGTRDYLLINKLVNVSGELYRCEFNGDAWVETRIDTPTLGNISVVAANDSGNDYFITYSGFLNPTSLYYGKLETGELALVDKLPDFFDASGLEVNQREAVSIDGERIPYFIISPKGMKLDGSNPTVVYGYGGFEVSQKPFYSAGMGISWLERGNVFVVANIRGGGEFGPAWHQAALKENRQVAFDDFYAVAEDLVEAKVTSPEHMGVYGGSNGGLLVGVAFTQRPDLYNAVVCTVPLLDMKRYSKLLAGASWMGEYGNPDIEEEWEYIRKYSPYQNVETGKKYPKVFFNTSTRDDRVHPAHARKMTAKLESLGYPVLYYENTEGGHGAATNNKQSAYRTALIYCYLEQQLK